jgi:hypothetical protein
MEPLYALLAPWQSLYADSVVVSTAVTTAHVLSLVVGGGLAIAADRSTLRIARRPAADRLAHLEELRATHRPVLIALVALFASGVLIATADLETFVGSWVFWLKLGLVALLLANGVVLARAENALRRAGEQRLGATDLLWSRLRAASIASLTLWLVTAVVGEVLASAA